MQKTTIERVYRDTLAREAVGRHPALRIRLGLEGYADYTFGARTGPSLGFDNLCHEMAHAVQFGPDAFDARCSEGGEYVFDLRQVWVYDQFCAEPQTAQPTLREAEVVAISLHLLEIFGRRIDRAAFFADWVRPLAHLPDWYQLGGLTGRKTTLPPLMQGFYENWTKPDILQRLEGWLDKTQLRLTRLKEAA